MTLNGDSIQAMACALADRGVYSVKIREVDGGADIEIADDIHTVDSLAVLLKLQPATIRKMEKIGLLHAIKTRGGSGSLRFRQSRVYADLKRAEDLRR